MAAVCAVGVVALGAGPAYAGCSDTPPHPDGRIRKVGGEYKGQGLIECNGVTQNTVSVTRKVGKVAEFEVRFRNLEDDPRDVVLRNIVVPNPKYKVKIFQGSNDITNNILVTGGGGRLFDVAGGDSSPKLRIRMKVRSAADVGDQLRVIIAGNFEGSEGDNYDAVHAVVEVAS